MHGKYGWGMGFGGGLFMILFWLLLIVVIVFLVRLVIRGSKGEDKSDTAIDILKKRYAKGEISREEFEEKIKHIL